jgi:hypothetical protein
MYVYIIYDVSYIYVIGIIYDVTYRYVIGIIYAAYDVSYVFDTGATGGEKGPAGQDLRYQFQKRSIYMAKETYSCGKRGLFMWQKRRIHMAKEAYLH